MKTTAILLVPALLGLVAIPAQAIPGNGPLTVTGAQAPDPDTIRVSYADLDMANPDNATVLRTRLGRAISRKCGELYGGGLLEQSWSCRDIAWQIAKPQFDAAIGRQPAGMALTRRVLTISFARR